MTNPSPDQVPAGLTAPRFDPSRGDKPVRSITASVTIEADSWADFRRELVCMIDDIDRNGRVRNVISGGWGSGRSVNSTFNPEITHEVWSRNLDAYIDYAEARDTSTIPLLADAAGEALDWFSGQHRLSLEHYSPMYGDDDDQAVEWRVQRESGSINDREWETVGRGETALAAILSAQSTLKERATC